MDNKTNRLLIIDGMSLIYRAYYGYNVNNFISKNQATNAIHGFFTMFLNLVDETKPSHICVALDSPKGNFRKEQYKEYKAGRQQQPDFLKSQIPLIKEGLKLSKIPTVELFPYEADDIISTYAKRATENKLHTRVVSSDKDLIQTVSHYVHLARPIKGVKEMQFVTLENVDEIYGLPAERYREMAALVGEKSDNILGVPGVGAKTALKLLLAYDSIDDLLDNSENIPGKIGENITSHKELILNNLELNKMVNNISDIPDISELLYDYNTEGIAFQEYCESFSLKTVSNKSSRILFKSNSEELYSHSEPDQGSLF